MLFFIGEQLHNKNGELFMIGYRGNDRTCAVVGRDDSNAIKAGAEPTVREALRKLMISIISDCGCKEFISGMHRGGELLGAELAIELKNEFEIKLWGILSSEEQWVEWTATERERFFSLMEKADYEYRVSDRETDESRKKQLKIIEEEADIIIAFGGRECREINAVLARAIKKRKKVLAFNPENSQISSFPGLV